MYFEDCSLPECYTVFSYPQFGEIVTWNHIEETIFAVNGIKNTLISNIGLWYKRKHTKSVTVSSR
jgi:hypothetical protein